MPEESERKQLYEYSDVGIEAKSHGCVRDSKGENEGRSLGVIRISRTWSP